MLFPRADNTACSARVWIRSSTRRELHRGNLWPHLSQVSVLNSIVYLPVYSLRDVDMWFSVVLGVKPWLREYDLVPLPWRISTSPPWSGSNGRIRLGVMWHDGVVLPLPPIRRALKTLVDALSKIPAFEIVEYAPFKHLQVSALAVSMRMSNCPRGLTIGVQHELYFVDGGARIRERAAVTGEPILPLTEWVITRPTVKDHTMDELWDVRVPLLLLLRSQN